MIRSLLLSGFLALILCGNTFSQTVYYSKSNGFLNSVATWGTNTNGTGASPANFTSANCIFVVVNNTTPTINGNWTVSGTGSRVVVGDGTQTINFTIPFGRTVAATFSVVTSSTVTANAGCTIGASLVHLNGGTFNNRGTSNPSLGTLTTNSTFIYSRNGIQTIVNGTYGNLVLSGSGTKSLNNLANTTVNGNFTAGSGCTFALNTTSPLICFINGTINGAGTVTGGSASSLVIGGSGPAGTLNLTSGAQTLSNFVLDRASAGTLTLGGSLTVNDLFWHLNGVLALNGNSLSLLSNAVFPASLSNGSLSGTTTSTLSITAGTISNNLYFTSGAENLGRFTFNSSATLQLGTSVSVVNYNHTGGVLNLNGNTLSITSTIMNLPPSIVQGSFTGSSTSNLSISATSIPNDRLFMTAGAEVLGNFTFDCPGEALRIGSSITVEGTFTHLNGILNLMNSALTFNGPVVFPASAANGSFSGSTGADITVAASSVANRMYFTVGAQALRNFTVNSPGVTLGMGTNLTLAGAYTHTSGFLDLGTTNLTMNSSITFPASAAAGSISGSATSTLTIGGTGTITNALVMTQSGTASYLNNLTLNRAGATVTLGNTLNIVGELTPTAGTFASAGFLVLRATSSTNVGRIGVIGTSGSVTGSVLAQMYAKGGNTGWTHLASPGLTGRTFADWDDNTTITCLNCPDGNFGFTSVYAYSETVGGLYDNALRYIPINNITDAMPVGQGFWVYLGTSTTTSADIILDAFGPVNQGNFSFNLTFTPIGGGAAATDHGYNLISNPYPSPISWSALRAGNTNVADAIYVYNPDLSGYATYVNGISSPAVGSGGIGNAIPAGQAFFVKASAATTLNAQETNKLGSTQELLKLGGQQQTNSSVALLRLKASGQAMKSETVVYFDANATTAYETEYDALYLGADAGMLGMASRLNGYDYAINALPALTQNFSVPVLIRTGVTGTYTITGDDIQSLPGGACIKLYDNYTGLEQDLRTGNYICTINDTEQLAPRFTLNITINNSLSVSASTVNASCSNSSDGALIASASGTGPWNYYWKDSANNILQTTLNKNAPDTLAGLSPGSYQVDVNTAGTCDNGSVSMTIGNSGLTGAAYTPSAYTVTLISDSVGVTFTNTSSNATAYWWNFGDGMGSACFDTTHYYMAPGDYTVTLYAINQACSDTAVYSEVIHVMQGNSTGIAVAEPTGAIMISRDALGYYAQFDLPAETMAEVGVHNLLGEKINGLQAPVHKDRVYIPLGEASRQIIVISVVTASGEKTFCKIVH